MMCRCAWALAAVLGFAVTSAQAQSDVIKLRLDQAPTLTLGYDGEDDEDLYDVGYRRYGGHHGGYGGYHGGYRGYHRPSFSIGFSVGRPYYGGYYPRSYYYPRHSYGFNYVRPSYYYSRPAYYQSYYQPSYYQPSYYSRPAYYNGGGYGYSSCWPISLSTSGFSIQLGSYPASVLNPEPLPNYLPQPKTIETPGPMLPADQVPNRQPEIRIPDNRTFPYDGGPSEPVPVPSVEPSNLRPTVPLEGRPVSLPATAKATKFAYPAYGEERSPSKFAEDRTIPVQAPGAAARK